MYLKSVLSILLSFQVCYARLLGQLVDKDVDENSMTEYLPLRHDGLNGNISAFSRAIDEYRTFFYEKELRAHNTDSRPIFIGTSDPGVLSTADSVYAYVSKIQMYHEDVVYFENIFGVQWKLTWIIGLTVEFSDGSVQEYGKKAFNVKSITLSPGETIKGDITICGTGIASGVGYYGFETSLGQKFEVGSKSYDDGPRNEYYFDADGHSLTGFFLTHDSTRVLSLGTKVMKEIESVSISNVEYQGFVDNAEVPIWHVDSQVESKISGGNSGTYSVFFEKAKESVHSFTSESTNFFKTALGVSVSVTATAQVPDILSVEQSLTTSFAVEMGTTSTEREMESSKNVERISQEIKINFDANRNTETTIMQAEYPQTYNWIAKEKFKFKDGTPDLEFDTSGTYSGTLVSELELKSKVTCLDNSEVISGLCPGEPGYSANPDTPENPGDPNCFRSFRNILHKMSLKA